MAWRPGVRAWRPRVVVSPSCRRRPQLEIAHRVNARGSRGGRAAAPPGEASSRPSLGGHGARHEALGRGSLKVRAGACSMSTAGATRPRRRPRRRHLGAEPRQGASEREASGEPSTGGQALAARKPAVPHLAARARGRNAPRAWRCGRFMSRAPRRLRRSRVPSSRPTRASAFVTLEHRERPRRRAARRPGCVSSRLVKALAGDQRNAAGASQIAGNAIRIASRTTSAA